MSLLARTAVGAECENRWNGIAEAEAIARYERQPKLAQVRAAQARTALIPLKQRPNLRPSQKETLEDVAGDIDDALGGNRWQQAMLKRPKGKRQDLIKAVAKQARLTPRMVTRYWSEYRNKTLPLIRAAADNSDGTGPSP